MTAITPPPPPSSSQPPPSLPVLPAVDSSSAITRLAPGTQLQALVWGRQDKGLLRVQTPEGSLSLRTNLPLPPNAELTLSLQTAQPEARFKLLAINGKPPHVALPLLAAQGAGSGSAVTGPLAGITVFATLVKPAPGLTVSSAKTKAPAPAAAGMTAKAPAPAQQPQASPPLNATVKTQVQGFAGRMATSGMPVRTLGAASHEIAQGPTAPQAGGIPAAAGDRMNVQITSIQAPGQGMPAIAASSGEKSLAAGQLLTGTVTGTNAQGQPLVSTPIGALALETPLPMALGSGVELRIKDIPLLLLANKGTAEAAAREALVLSRGWPALQEAVQALHETHPAIARQILNTVIPSPGAQLGATLMLFLGALRGGDIRGWLGEEPLKVLEQTSPALAKRLRSGFDHRAKLSNELQQEDWRVSLAPMQNQGEIEQIRLLARHPAQEEQSKEKGSRFAVDVSLTRLGRIQLDGLLRERGKRLDLIIRTDSPFTTRIRDDIRSIFRDAIELTGLRGGVTFQSNPPNFIEIKTKPVSEEDGRGVVV